jgi:hypothetical protein
MALDPSIILGVQSPKLQLNDPLETYTKGATLQALLGQHDLQGLQINEATRKADAERRIAALFSGNPNASSAEVMGIDPVQGLAFRKAELENQMHQSTIGKNLAEIPKIQQETSDKADAAYRNAWGSVSNPQQAAQLITAGFNNPILAPRLAMNGSLEDHLARIPNDPQTFGQWVQHITLGGAKYAELNKPHITSQNLGGMEQLTATPGLGGTPTVLSSTPRTATPGEVQSNALGYAHLAETKRHNAAVEGDPAMIESTAQAIARGELAPLSSFALARPAGQAIMGRVAQISQEQGKAFDPTAFATRQKTEKDFGTGKQGQAVKSFNVALSHLDQLGGLIDAMGTGDAKLVNKVGNVVKTQLGTSTAPTNFDAAKQIVGDEIVKAIIGSGGGVGDRDKAQAVLDKANSPKLLKGVIDTYKGLMSGQLQGLELQYKAAGGKKDFRNEFLSDNARNLMEKHAATTGAVTPSDNVPDVTTHPDFPGFSIAK